MEDKNVEFQFIQKILNNFDDKELQKIEDINQISIFLNNHPDLKLKHINKVLEFILNNYTDRKECLAKLKVLNNTNNKPLDFDEDIIKYIFYIVLQIKKIKFCGDVESDSMFLVKNMEESFYNNLVKWYYKQVTITRSFFKLLCEEISLILRIRILKDSDSEESDEGSEDELIDDESTEDEISEYNFNDENKGDIISVLEEQVKMKKKNKLDSKRTLERLITLLTIITDKNEMNIKDFYRIASFLQVDNKRFRQIIKNYIKNLQNKELICEYFIDSLKISNSVIHLFPIIYGNCENFDWDQFISVIKSISSIETKYLKEHKMPLNCIKILILEGKRKDDLIKSQIRKLNIEELNEINDLVKQKNIKESVLNRKNELSKN